MTNPIRIVIADDHPVVCLGVASLLSSASGVTVVGRASDAHSLVECLDACPCDVVVTDIGMPGLNGESNAIPLLRKMLRDGPHPYVVVLTMIHHRQTLAGLLKMGVSAIVDKRDVASSLIDAIESAGTGEPYLSAHVAEMIARADGISDADSGVLSPREWEVFQLYAQGMEIGKIAQRLGRSDKTISTQKRSAMRKLGLDSDIQLIRYAYQIGLA